FRTVGLFYLHWLAPVRVFPLNRRVISVVLCFYPTNEIITVDVQPVRVNAVILSTVRIVAGVRLRRIEHNSVRLSLDTVDILRLTGLLKRGHHLIEPV